MDVAPKPGPAALALKAWDQAEPHVLRFVLKAVLTVSVTIATPFLALAILFLLLAKPLLWVAIPASIGALLLALGLVAFLVLRHKLRRLRAKVEAVREFETLALAATGR